MNCITPTLEEVLAGLQMCCNFFERQSQKEPVFTPEYEVSKAINSILEQKGSLKKTDVIEILDLYNEINKVEHYDGVAWYDYTLRLTYFLRLKGFKTETGERNLYVI